LEKSAIYRVYELYEFYSVEKAKSLGVENDASFMVEGTFSS